MLDLALRILVALQLQEFIGELNIIAKNSKLEIFINPPLTQAQVKLIPDSVKDNCTVSKEGNESVITVRL